MAAGLLFLTFFAFHGTSGNQTENNGGKCLSLLIMKWKPSSLLTLSFVSLTLLVFAGILLELPLAKIIKGTFTIRIPNIRAKKPAKKSISTVAPTKDIFAEAEERQRERKEQLEKYCLKHVDQNLQPKRQQLGQLLLDDDNKFIYCAVPKSASTPMKRTLLNLRNDSEKFKNRNPHVPSLWQHLSEYNESENSKRLQTHFKFLFVREPFHRLLSAYLDKFFGNNRLYTNGFRQMIVKTYRPEDVEEVSTKSNNVTFTEFLRFIVTSSNFYARDDHWRQYEHLCFPCFFKFDFIGHFETLADDINYVLKKAGFNKHVTFPPFHSSRVSSTFLTYYSQVPQDIIFRLGEAFRNDFEMFGYPFPGPLKSLLGNYTSA